MNEEEGSLLWRSTVTGTLIPACMIVCTLPGDELKLKYDLG
jgi:hypothetical protein